MEPRHGGSILMRTVNFCPQTLQRAAVLALVTSLSLGCAHQVNVVTNPPGAMVELDGVALGSSPVSFKETPWPGAHRVRVKQHGYLSREVEVERSEINWLWVGLGLGGCSLCAVPGCLAGASVANLSLCPACAGCLLTSGSSLGAVISIVSAPSLCTIPAASIGALLGSSPLGLLALGDQSPDTLKITLKVDPLAPVQEQTPLPPLENQEKTPAGAQGDPNAASSPALNPDTDPPPPVAAPSGAQSY